MPRPKSDSRNPISALIKLALVAVVIVFGVLGYQEYRKNATGTFDGVYRGNIGVSAGLVDVTVNVSKSVITGNATLKGNAAGYDLTIPVDLRGAAQTSGQVSTSISGMTYVDGQPFNAGGSASGQANGNDITYQYSIIVAGKTFSGNVILVK